MRYRVIQGSLAAGAILLLGFASSGQTDTKPASTVRIVSPRPLGDAASLLQETYGKVVTYEEPILLWSGELEPIPGKEGSRKYLYPRTQGFSMPSVPAPGSNLATDLRNTVDAYHRQAAGPRFRVLTSKLGYHLVPVQSHDENGALVPTVSVLDARVTVAVDERTPAEHLRALGAGVSAATGTAVDMTPLQRPGDFDRAFRANPGRFRWGANDVAARDAMIDLFLRSATTFTWHLMCQASSQRENRFCALNLKLLEVAATDAEGKPAKRVLTDDRCGDCR